MAFIGTDIPKSEVFSNLETLADIPLTDEAAWETYSKYRWVCSTSRLLDLQGVPWSIFYGAEFSSPLVEFSWAKQASPSIVAYPGMIFVNPNYLQGDSLTTDVAILKGEVKWLAHHTDKQETLENEIHIGKKVLDKIHGEVELRIAAFVKMALPKFTGVISVDTIGSVIIAVRLHMTPDVVNQYPEDWLKKAIKLYNRKQWPK